MTAEEAARYTRVAVALHWVIAVLLIGNLILGLYHDDFGKAATPWVMFVHKAAGLTVLVLTLARLAWRLTHRPPAFDPALKPWERSLASATHWLFYLMLIAIPLSGWMLSSSGGRVTNFWGLFDVAPLPVPRTDDAGDLFEDTHELLGKLMIGLILLHVAGALKHHVQGHRQMMARMAPWLDRRR
ncbi:MAG TPA: cytochrome b [Allosphingosinicella sp.]